MSDINKNQHLTSFKYAEQHYLEAKWRLTCTKVFKLRSEVLRRKNNFVNQYYHKKCKVTSAKFLGRRSAQICIMIFLLTCNQISKEKFHNFCTDSQIKIMRRNLYINSQQIFQLLKLCAEFYSKIFYTVLTYSFKCNKDKIIFFLE